MSDAGDTVWLIVIVVPFLPVLPGRDVTERAAVFLVLLGIVMEIMQGMTAYRYFDLFDAVANTLGVLAGILVLYFGADKILLWFECRFLKTT